MESLEITFKIDAPHTEYQSDLNTLILRIDKLRQFYNNYEKSQSNINVEVHNKNIECIEEILQHMKFRTINNEVIK